MLAPPLAVSAVSVPPLEALELVDGAPPCCPAWLLPPLASVEIAAPLSRPLAVVEVASADTSEPLPCDACGAAPPDDCAPAWLLPPLACAETAAPLAAPLNVPSLAKAETWLPLP